MQLNFSWALISQSLSPELWSNVRTLYITWFKLSSHTHTHTHTHFYPYIFALSFKHTAALSAKAVCTVLYTQRVYVTDKMENALLIKLLSNNMQMSFILSCSKLQLRGMLKLQETQER